MASLERNDTSPGLNVHSPRVPLFGSGNFFLGKDDFRLGYLGFENQLVSLPRFVY